MQSSRHAFVLTTFMLVSIGVIMVLSASLTSQPTDQDQIYFTRHVTFLAIASVVALIAARLPVSAWRRLAPWLFGGTLVLLVLVLIPGIGVEVNGARRWLRWGTVSLQPSEIAKVTLPLFLCAIIDRRRRSVDGDRDRVMPPLIPIAVAGFLVLQEPDLGTAVFLCCGAFLCLFLSGQRLWHFLLAGGLVAPAAAGFVALRPYQIQRLQGFLQTWSDFRLAPYQIRQSLATLGTGGMTGEGLGRGWQKLSFLPEANTDFVFAVVGEELGLVGTLGILILWIALYGFGVQMLSRLPQHSFEYVLSLTLLTQLVMQAATNVAIVSALLPPKGIPHPLLSYGGSSLLMSLASVGIILSLSRPVQTDLSAITKVDDTPPVVAERPSPHLRRPRQLPRQQPSASSPLGT